MQILENLSNVDLMTKRATIVISAGHVNGQDAFHELSGADARRMAAAYAQGKGMAGAATSHAARVYPVDATGAEVTDPINQKTADYRAEIKLLSPVLV